MKQCPRCFSEITELDEFCPRCGMKIEGNVKKEYKNSLKKERKLLKKQKKLEKKNARKLLEEKATNFDDFKAVDYMTRKQVDKALKYDVDEDNKIDIDTSDVELIDEQKLYNSNQKQTYSVKKARGEYYQEKVKWWEIYKRANRSFARRKIKKEVNKASKIKPEFVSKSKLLTLAILLGWFGAHNFYAKNKKKAWLTLICSFLWFGYVIFVEKLPFLKLFESICAIAGMIVLFLWFYDIVNIITNNFKYRVQKIAFVSRMNIETRAKLGNKYIDMDLYQKPFYVKFKHWLSTKRKDYADYRQKRRQKLIEKEKAKEQSEKEKQDFDAQVEAHEKFEQNEFDKLKANKEIMQNVEELKKDVYNDDGSQNEKKFAEKKQPKIKINTKKKK